MSERSELGRKPDRSVVDTAERDAVQLAWSAPWLRAFRFDPAEWAWRSATYRRVQPFRA